MDFAGEIRLVAATTRPRTRLDDMANTKKILFKYLCESISQPLLYPMKMECQSALCDLKISGNRLLITQELDSGYPQQINRLDSV